MILLNDELLYTYYMPNPATKSIDQALKSVARNEPVHVRINGSCMMPLIENGVRIQVKNQHRYFPGDILVKRDGNGMLVAHRLLGAWPRHGKMLYVTRADNAAGADAAVTGSQVLGRLSGGDCDSEAYAIPFATRVKALGQFFALLLKTAARKIRRSF